MSEDQLKNEFRNQSNCYADADDMVMAMDEESAIAFAKSVALVYVAPKDAQIAELTRKLQIQDTMHANTEAVLTEEIKRLREGIRKALKYIEGPHHSNPEPIAIYEILQHIISPSDGDGETKAAPVVDEFIKGLDYCECNGCGWVGQVGETIEIDYFDSCPKCKEQSMYLLEDDQAEDHWNEYRVLKPMTGRGIEG